MQTLEGQKIVVTGGSRGLGLGIVQALVACKAKVTVVARDTQHLAAVRERLGVETVRGDVADAQLARDVLRSVQPSVLVLNAGAAPPMGALHELSWDEFSRVWEVDVKAGFHWLGETLRQPLPRGARVIITSSGAAVNGSPLSGGYAGAKRMQWLMAQYANNAAGKLGLDTHYQAIVPQQMIGGTGVGDKAAQAYSSRQGISAETFLAGFGTPMPPEQVGEHVVAILTQPQYAAGVAFGMRGDRGIVSLNS